MALFVRRGPGVVTPGPEWPVYRLLRTPGGRELLPADIEVRLRDPHDSLGLDGGRAVDGGDREGGDASKAEASSPEKTAAPQVGFTLAALALFVAGTALAVVAFGTPEEGPTYTAAAGIGAFALFYIAAQAAERLAELVLPYLEWLPGFGKAEKEATRDAKVADAYNTNTSEAAKNAAEAQADVDQARANRSIVVFGFTAAAGMWLCGYLEADFLTAVGVSFAAEDGAAVPSTFQQVLAMAVTGLIVGGGSKGLHDLISNVSKASSSKDTPAETGGSA